MTFISLGKITINGPVSKFIRDVLDKKIVVTAFGFWSPDSQY